MEKFKHIKKSLKEIKCFVKRTLMSRASTSNEPNSRIKPKNKQLTTGRPSSTNTGVASTASNAEEGFIPLAARDSQWVGLDFYNPHFRSPLDEEDDVEEVELQNLAADGIEAIYLLFPGLAKVKTNSSLLKERESSSTTEITKLLVGQKADFRNMRSSKRLILTDSKLGSVPEAPLEEKVQSDTDVSTCTTFTKKSVTDVESRAICADDEAEEPEQEKRIKKRRKKSEIRMTAVASSSSFIPTSSNIRQSTVKIQKSGVNLSSDSTENKPQIDQK